MGRYLSSVTQLMRTGGWFFIGLFLLSGKPVAGELTKGPMLLRAETGRAALMFESDRPARAQVFWSEAGQSQPMSLSSYPIDINYRLGELPIMRFVHKVWLEGLRPAAEYKYYILEHRMTEPSPTYTFRTPKGRDEAVRFAVYGDCRSFAEQHRRIIQRIIQEGVNFVVVTGDLVGDGNQYEKWSEEFFDPLKGLAESVPIYALKGNHDQSKEGYFEKLLVPPGENSSFSFNYGSVHYWCGDNYSEEAGKLLAMMEQDIKSSRGGWLFVSLHEPSLNLGGHYSTWGYPQALPTFSRTGVDFVVTGHSHIYERFRPLAPPKDTKGSFVTFITTAGGGAPLHESGTSEYLAQGLSRHHFCLFEVTPQKVQLRVIDIDGAVIDQLEVTKQGGQPNKAYTDTAVPMELIQLYQDLRHCVFKAPVRPRKQESFEMAASLSAPSIKTAVKAILKLRCAEGTYKVGPEKTVEILPVGGMAQVRFSVQALVDTKAAGQRARLLDPALWIDCHYEISQGSGDISWPVLDPNQP